ncbi:MAG: transglutaminase family protein [Leptolyngbya sp. SIO1D8]|nr:transglutaminase family protein [Leptolyngbya sp. SIO1D8]
MRYQISHTTHYTYTQSVFLSNHVLRLRPRSDAHQTLHHFAIDITPTPELLSEQIDLFGGSCLGLWFANKKTSDLKIQTYSEIETHCTQPFQYLIEPWATTLPIDYSSSVLNSLMPYFHGALALPVAANVLELAHEVLHEVDHNLSFFLTTLTQYIYNRCTYVVREKGSPLPSGITWQAKQGTCRDFVVLFMDACRAVGIAARFVSGYQEGDPDQEMHDLHAWAEVYVPGGGWRGFDPTHGLAVSDRHVALAVGVSPQQATPVTGSLREGQMVQSNLTTQITVKRLD